MTTANRLKFRAWHKGKMYAFDPIKMTTTDNYIGSLPNFRVEADLDEKMDYEPDIYNHDDYQIDVGEYVLMQSTGLLDLNGKEIFEDDIVKYMWANPNTYLGVVRFDSGRFFVDPKTKKDLFDDQPFDGVEEDSRIEVIGNVWENPELLPPAK